MSASSDSRAFSCNFRLPEKGQNGEFMGKIGEFVESFFKKEALFLLLPDTTIGNRLYS